MKKNKKYMMSEVFYVISLFSVIWTHNVVFNVTYHTSYIEVFALEKKFLYYLWF